MDKGRNKENVVLQEGVGYLGFQGVGQGPVSLATWSWRNYQDKNKCERVC